LLHFFFIEIDHLKDFLILGTACMFPGNTQAVPGFLADRRRAAPEDQRQHDAEQHARGQS
jgi:hypothetical protein